MYTVLHKRSNNTASFVEHLKYQEKVTYADALWINCNQLKYKNWNQDPIHFEIATYRVLHKQSNNTTSLAKRLKFQEKLTFVDSI